jgi:hypothetical protein
MKCAFKNCKKPAVGSKQFNDIVERIYLCTDHLIEVAELNSWSEGMKFIQQLKESGKKLYEK